MAKRKAKVELYWAPGADILSPSGLKTGHRQAVVNWRLVGANGEVMCQCTQGFRDKTDALRNVCQCVNLLYGAVGVDIGYSNLHTCRVAGPGKKPS